MPVAGETLKLARQRAGLNQVELAQKVGATRQTISLLEQRASVDDSQHLGKILDVLGLDPNGLPKGTASLVDADLRGMQVHDLIALQNQLTAEFGRRLGVAGSERSAPIGHAADDPDAAYASHDPRGSESSRAVRRRRSYAR